MQFVGKKDAFLHFLAFFGCSDYLPLACSSVSRKDRLLADRSLPELWAQIGESNSDQHDTGIERSLQDRQICDWLTTGGWNTEAIYRPGWKQHCIFTLLCEFRIYLDQTSKERLFWWACSISILDLSWLKCVLWLINEAINLISGLSKRETWIQKV